MLTSLNRSGLTGPLVAVSAGIIALMFLQTGSETKLVVDANSLGPASWPRVMLIGVIVSGLLWGWSRWKPGKHSVSQDPGNETQHDNLKLAVGLFAIILYGAAMVYLGFAFAAFLFLVSWFLIGGLRAPLLLFTNSLLTTIALLYLFLKIAYLPLPRGVGFMDTLTVNLCQYLGIF